MNLVIEGMDNSPTPETSSIELNDLSRNSKGGTELMLGRLHNSIDKNLLDEFQIIPSRVRDLDPNRKKILWLHDLPNDPESAHLAEKSSRDRFDKIVMVSDWQMQYYNLALGVPYEDCIVLPNAIEPIEMGNKTFDGKVRLTYHTTPHRGLEILVPVFEHLATKLDHIHLDVFSSFAVYGWEERDRPYEELFQRCKDHPQITYHGAQSNEEVRKNLKHSHIMAFPSIWPETSCLAVIEAMSAKNNVVCPNLAALPETTSKWASMYQWKEGREEHAKTFAHMLIGAIKAAEQKEVENDIRHTHYNFQKSFYDNFYSWDNRAKEWEALLKSLL